MSLFLQRRRRCQEQYLLAVSLSTCDALFLGWTQERGFSAESFIVVCWRFVSAQHWCSSQVLTLLCTTPSESYKNSSKPILCVMRNVPHVDRCYDVVSCDWYTDGEPYVKPGGSEGVESMTLPSFTQPKVSNDEKTGMLCFLFLRTLNCVARSH